MTAPTVVNTESRRYIRNGETIVYTRNDIVINGTCFFEFRVLDGLSAGEVRHTVCPPYRAEPAQEAQR